MCLAEFAAYYYKDYKSDVSETIDAKPEILSDDIIAQLHENLRWLKTVSNTYIWIGRYNNCLSFDATIMVSKNCPIIGEHVVIIFLAQ